MHQVCTRVRQRLHEEDEETRPNQSHQDEKSDRGGWRERKRVRGDDSAFLYTLLNLGSVQQVVEQNVG